MIESKIDIANITFTHPSDWNVIKIKYLLSTKVTDGPHETPTFIDEGYPFLSVDSIVDGKLVFEGCRYISKENYDKYKLKCNPQKDDIFMGKAASIGKIAIVDVDFNFSIWSPLALLRPNKNVIFPKFLEFALKSDYAQDQIDLYSTSNTQKNISMDDIPRIELLVPNLEQQKAITNYLIKKTSKIDATIAKNEELIQLLEEKRVALINQVVTKGLNPDVPMKDSGVEWIGKIPEHWNIMKLKHHGFVLGGYAFKSGDFTDSGVKVVKITNVQSLKFDWSECFYLPKSYLHEHSEFKINKGDIIFALTRPIISTGIKAAIFEENEPALANQRTGIFKKHSNDLISTFLYYVIYSDYFKEDFKSKITATNQPNISPLDIGEIKLIIPSVEEQKQIVSKLDEETKKISEVISKIKENINLLEEYKTSLIHNVVTGKIDVREECYEY